MKEIELTIKIYEEQYEHIKQNMTMDKVKDYHILLYDICERIKNGTVLPKGHERLIDADKVKKDIIDWFMYTVNSKHNSIPKDCDELIKYITGWVTYAIDKTPTIIEADKEN